MAKIQDLEEFLRACRELSVYTPEVDERFRKCVSSAVGNGFGESDLAGLESSSDRKFVLRGFVSKEEIGSYAASFKTLVRDHDEWVSDPVRFLSSGRARRFQKKGMPYISSDPGIPHRKSP